MDHEFCVIPLLCGTFYLDPPADISLPREFDVSFVSQTTTETLYSIFATKTATGNFQMTKILPTQLCENQLIETVALRAKENTIVTLLGADITLVALIERLRAYRRAVQAERFGLPICDLHFNPQTSDEALRVRFTEA